MARGPPLFIGARLGRAENVAVCGIESGAAAGAGVDPAFPVAAFCLLLLQAAVRFLWLS